MATGSRKDLWRLDEAAQTNARLHDAELWWAVLKNVRAGFMPPAGKPRPNESELMLLEDWIKSCAFGIEPTKPDPGRVPVRRLNRVEYRNTIRDLMGIDFDTSVEFPPDDSGHGFDNMADVLTFSPMLLEKYLAAAKSIVSRSVPVVPRVVPEIKITGQQFRRAGSSEAKLREGPISLSYDEPATVTKTYHVDHAGHYQLVLDLTVTEVAASRPYYNRCRVVLKSDGKELFSQEFTRQESLPFQRQLNVDWTAGDHELSIVLEPVKPGERQLGRQSITFHSVTVRGPWDRQFWISPPNYSRFFPGDAPEAAAERKAYSRSLLRPFARKAFRRPVDQVTLDRLASLAEREYSLDGRTFEAGVAQAMGAILTSPTFLFREEGIEEDSSDQFPLINEYSLASRLSYFLWSSMPDDELFRLAETHELRKKLPAQVERMLADPKSAELIRHFVGQWLQARDIDTVPINSFAVISRDQPVDPDAKPNRLRWQQLSRKLPNTLTESETKELNRARARFFKSFRGFRENELSDDLREAMRRETEMLLDRIIRENRSLKELLLSDYTFVNERLARHYGIEGVKGTEMRLVNLPPGSPRGGVLTQGTVLVVTSNPDRTSPVKRGLFILDNILGIPPPPPPPNIPPLEEATKAFGARTPSLRETLELHRSRPACSSCHNRMDPLGLALENFNATGQWREREQGNPVDSTGKLISGEPFSTVQDLK